MGYVHIMYLFISVKVRPKTLHFTSDGVHLLIAVWGVGGLWTMEADAMACEPLVQPSKDGDELLKQTGTTPLQNSKVDSTTWMKLCDPSGPCGQDGGHPVLWSNYVVQYEFVSAYDPLLSSSYTRNCPNSMLCTSRNVTVWQSYLQKTNHSVPFECNHLLILLPFASKRHTCTSFLFSNFVWKLCTDWARHNTDISGDTRDVTIGSICTPSIWKCNQLLLVHWSTLLPSLESCGPFRLGVALFINSSVLRERKG